MSNEPGEALEVLRGIWDAQGQGSADLARAFGPAKQCKRMAEVGFEGFVDDSADDSGDDLRAAWRARLEREGKLGAEGASVKDLVLDPSHAR